MRAVGRLRRVGLPLLGRFAASTQVGDTTRQSGDPARMHRPQAKSMCSIDTAARTGCARANAEQAVRVLASGTQDFTDADAQAADDPDVAMGIARARGAPGEPRTGDDHRIGRRHVTRLSRCRSLPTIGKMIPQQSAEASRGDERAREAI
jgi:hypothetical protein